MLIIPAIDLLNGKCVRLFQGNYKKETVYDNNPLEVAAKWISYGIERLHIIDLDGAKAGYPKNIDIISKKMWKNYGRILSEYIYIKKFRNSKNKKTISVEGQEILDEIKNTKEPVVFISGHFNNFELMAMQIEKSGINLAAIYRPLNNIFLNKIMERLRIKYICKKQIKKGRSGTRDLVESFKKKYSIALMIDQRVSEGIKCSLFGQPALTTTIPAQLFKKFGCKIVPVYIERINDIFFKITVSKPIIYSKETSIEEITLDLNKWLERKILNNPTQWIWSHDRWK